jgi:hypothetical protein
MRTVALIFLTVGALVGTVGAVSAQYGGGYFGPAHTMAVATTTMADTIGEATRMEPSSDTTDSAGRNGIFLLGQAVVVRGITPSKMDCANRIRIAAPTTETLVESHFRLADVRYW